MTYEIKAIEYPQETDSMSEQVFSLIRKEVTSLPDFKDGVEKLEFLINW